MRLIDGNYLYDELKSNGIENMYLGSEVLKMVKEEPTIEAIPKADYENRLKADLVAMLTEIQLEIHELWDNDSSYIEGVHDSEMAIQQKIEQLKGENNG